MKTINENKIKRLRELLKAKKTGVEIQSILKDEFGTGVSNNTLKEEREIFKVNNKVIKVKDKVGITLKDPDKKSKKKTDKKGKWSEIFNRSDYVLVEKYNEIKRKLTEEIKKNIVLERENRELGKIHKLEFPYKQILTSLMNSEESKWLNKSKDKLRDVNIIRTYFNL